jgi:hypothetical protein
MAPANAEHDSENMSTSHVDEEMLLLLLCILLLSTSKDCTCRPNLPIHEAKWLALLTCIHTHTHTCSSLLLIMISSSSTSTVTL